MRLRLHNFLPHSRANGPGARAVVWVQGCSLACRGCFNPATHAFDRGEWMEVADLVARIRARTDLEGITLSGGEPLQQVAATIELLERIRGETSLTSILFTGFRWHEILRLPRSGKILSNVDVILAGRYDARHRAAGGWPDSPGKTAHFLTRRYSPADLEAVPEAELVIDADGAVTVSGVNPVLLHA